MLSFVNIPCGQTFVATGSSGQTSRATVGRTWSSASASFGSGRGVSEASSGSSSGRSCFLCMGLLPTALRHWGMRRPPPLLRGERRVRPKTDQLCRYATGGGGHFGAERSETAKRNELAQADPTSLAGAPEFVRPHSGVLGWLWVRNRFIRIGLLLS